MYRLKPEAPNHWNVSPVACGGLKPFSVIFQENAQPGTQGWETPSDRAATIQIQAYASANSVLPGQKITLYVSTLKPGIAYTIDIYRLGWYGGDGGRLLLAVPNQSGQAQGYYDATTHHLVGCLSCHVDAATGLVEANWHASYTFTVPADWTSGIYLAKETDVNGWQTYAVFDIRDTSHSHYLVVTPDLTYETSNIWGGYNLYEAYAPVGLAHLQRAVKVSFDRPYSDGYGASQVLTLEIDAIHWLERQGYDLSYMSDIDVHREPALLLQHRAYISLGHDEYWTKEMRDAVETARDQGVGLAFLEATASYWQARLEPDGAGMPFRTVVCFKVLTSDHDLSADPMFSKAGHTYGCNLVGYEWDRVFNNGVTPAGLQVLGTSSTVNASNSQDISNTTYYIAHSGAMVFATGSVYWTTALDNFRLFPNPGCPDSNHAVPGIQNLLANVMNALIIKHSPPN